MQRFLIVGLGNPGPRYRNTRHNVGFMALDRLAEELGGSFDREKFQGLVAEARHADAKVLLLKPLTFMNNSGQAVAQAARNAVDGPEQVLVVTDDVNLDLGRLRLRRGGSAGGHNGLKSIIAHLGGDFPRLRIGVGSNEPGASLTPHVLGSFRPEEGPVVQDAIHRAVEAARTFVTEGIDGAMNRFNASAPSGKAEQE
jgi:PTH1 family peptidyl-tRNA hydrolase